MRRWLAMVAAAATVVAGVFLGTRPPVIRRPVAGGRPLVLPAPDRPMHPRAAPRHSLSTIMRENERPGTSAWRLDPVRRGDIEGYASATSIAAGRPLGLFVRTSARWYKALVYRMGWYRGKGARLVAVLPPQPGDRQSACPALGVARMVTCSWRRSFILRTGTSWASGVYLIKLVSADGAESYVPFTLRERVARAPMLFQSSVTTWQAYNLWGGRNLYRGLVQGSLRTQSAAASSSVSFDRPYAWPGDGQFFRFEYPLLFWLESRGYDVAYATDVDLHERSAALAARRVFISVGHDEYYSTSMRHELETALSRGTSLAFFGANDIYRHIRFERSRLGPDRIEVHYKRAQSDPIYKSDPVAASGQWREPPLHDPEERLLGAEYSRCAPRAAWRATGDPPWLFRGTGLRRGDRIRKIVGYERDQSFPEWRPHGLVFVARSPVSCAGVSESDSTFYVARSGAGVFDAGTLWFNCALGLGCGDLPLASDSHIPADPRVAPDRRLERLVTNLLQAMLRRRFS